MKHNSKLIFGRRLFYFFLIFDFLMIPNLKLNVNDNLFKYFNLAAAQTRH